MSTVEDPDLSRGISVSHTKKKTLERINVAPPNATGVNISKSEAETKHQHEGYLRPKEEGFSAFLTGGQAHGDPLVRGAPVITETDPQTDIRRNGGNFDLTRGEQPARRAQRHKRKCRSASRRTTQLCGQASQQCQARQVPPGLRTAPP